jgi:hypothetical protein
MTMLPIDKNVPLPARFPFEQMEVGDSFAVPSGVHRTTVSIAALRYGRKHGRKFITRKMPDGTIRCWRVE